MKAAIVGLALSVAVIGALGAGAALADRAYHTERLTFEALDGFQELRAGHVVNAHSAGPTRYAYEQYNVNGAAPNATYDVVIEVSLDSESCKESPDLALPTAQLETNGAGAGAASHVFVPADVAPFGPPLTVHARWVLERDGTAEYATACTTINLD